MSVRSCPLCQETSARYERNVRGVDLARCRNCGFVFADLPNRTIAEANAALGADILDYYETSQADLDQVWFAQIAARFGRDGARVLDVGCGNGLLVEAFRRRGCAAEGLDPSQWARKAAVEKGFVLHEGYVEDERLPAGGYDTVTATSTFEHAPKPVQLARSLLRLVRPGGILYLCGMPNYGSWAVRIGLATFRHNNPPWHASFFTSRTLRAVFEHPHTRPFLDRSDIRTYGFPELHHYYSNAIRRRNQSVDPDGPARGKRHEAPASALQKLAIAAYIQLGRPLRLGDKLEVIVRRSQVPWNGSNSGITQTGGF